MDDIYVYLIPMPTGIHEGIFPCDTGYTIYLNTLDSQERRERAYRHAVNHIRRNDFNCCREVQEIEMEAHHDG